APAKNVVVLVVLGGLEWSLDPRLALVSFALAPFLAGGLLYFGPRLKRLAGRQREAQARLTSHVHQTLTAMPVVPAVGAATGHSDRFRRLANDAVVASQRGRALEILHENSAALITCAGSAVVVFLGGQRVLARALSLGSLIVFTAYLRSLQDAFRGLMETLVRARADEARVDRVVEVLNAEEEVRDLPDAVG